MLRGIPVAGKHQGLRGIPEDFASSGQHPEPNIVFVCLSNAAMAVARLSHPGVRPPAEPPARSSTKSDLGFVDECAHFVGQGGDTLRVAESNVEQRIEPERR